jgi:phosphoribosylanthranilate isomerase
MGRGRYVGVTGFTTLDDVAIMTGTLNGNFGMYGILMSHTTLREKSQRGRYAALGDIANLMNKMPETSLRTLHWCDSRWHDRKDPWRSIEIAIDSTKGACNAIQLNMEYPPVKYFEDLKEKHNLKTIFQIEAQMFEDPAKMREKMQPYAKFMDYVIIDQSMGAGIPIDPKISKAVAREVHSLNAGVVFAGGFNAKRVADIGDLIREFDASIDAEGQLMKDHVDELDHKKVKDYVSAAISVMQK